MICKTALALCLLFFVAALAVDAQRDGRRRTGRRKPTTEIPPPQEVESEIEKSPQNLDSEPETVAKPSSSEPAEPETNATPSAKDSGSSSNNNNANQGGPPFIVPRGTRKPRPMPVRSNGEARPKPTLPTFTRKSSGRIPKAERHDIKKTDSNGVVSPSTSTTTPKPSRGSSRRRNSSSQTSDRGSVNADKPSQPSSEATEAAPKKRFGGGATRRPSRGSRRGTTPVPEA